MEIFVIPAFIIFALICIDKMDKWRIDQATKRMAATPVKKQVEPIEKVVARIKDNERKDKEQDRKDWEKKYLTNLPVEKHPDYFIPSPADDKESVIQKNYAGEIIMQSHWWTNGRGQVYTVHPDWITNTITIKCGDIQWELPLDEYRFLVDRR